ncbi:hypothetical protein JAO77_11450 [Hymenobacter sp. BT559]|nr:hypothetical protein [Hymenobacter sp. BT559]
MDENKKDFLKKNFIKLISLWKTSAGQKLFHTRRCVSRGKNGWGTF